MNRVSIQKEYMATNHYMKEMVWLGQFLMDVRYVQERPTSMTCNNQGCIAFAENLTHHPRTKHIDVQHHFIREKLKNQKICLKYSPTEDMIADVLTKPLAKERRQALIRAMGLEAFDYPQSGSVEGRALDCSW